MGQGHNGRQAKAYPDLVIASPSGLNKIQNPVRELPNPSLQFVPFGVTYEKIGTIQRRLAWPLHKDDTLSRSGRSTDLNIYFVFLAYLSSALTVKIP
jgi:hypothetical protein